MIITNKFNLPKAFVDAIKNDEKEHNEKEFGVTTLLKPTREILLGRRHKDSIEVDVADCINKLFGTAFHSLIEQHDKTGMSELSFKEKVLDDYSLVGRLDLYDKNAMAIIDYKTATCWKVMFKDFEDWRKQGLMYAWLAIRQGYVVKKIIFYAFLKDWTARESRKQGDAYPESQIYTYEYNVKISDLIEIEDWLTKKFEEIVVAEQQSDDEIAPCSEEECWYTGNKWAVYKNSKDVKAQRVLETEQEVHDYITNKLGGAGIIEFRKGEYRKCQDYCEVCNFCKYYKERGGK